MPLTSAVSLACSAIAAARPRRFPLDAGERVALIGRNGTGKSSLLAALAGTARDRRRRGLAAARRAHRLRAAGAPFDPGQSVFAAVVAGMGETSVLLAEYHAVSHALADGADERAQEALLTRLHTLADRAGSLGAWSIRIAGRARDPALSASIPEARRRPLRRQKKRLALAQALALSPDVLLMDEPTNHLDIAAIGGWKTC